MKQSDFLKWDIDLIDPSYQDELGDGFVGGLASKIDEIVKNVASGVSTAAKKAAAISTGSSMDDQSTEQIDKAKREMLIFKITGRLGKQFRPVLDEMDRYLFTSDTQTAATNQHNQKMRDDQFRKEFLNELRQIAQLLPENHPVRLKIETSR